MQLSCAFPKAVRFVIYSAIFVVMLVAGCGGGSGSSNGSSSSGGGGSTGGGGTGGGNAGTGIALTAALQPGTYWEFSTNTETVTFAQGSGTTSSTDFGVFRLTLGTSVQIGGMTMFPVVLSGKSLVGGTSFAPRWSHIGISNGSLMGSISGGVPQTIYDGTTTSGVAAGFFISFAANETVNVSSNTFTGQYNTLPAIRMGHSIAKGGCETILGVTICQDTTTTFSEYEYYKDGIGPLGFLRNVTYSSNGGGFFTSTTIKNTVELIRTSLTATDNSIIRLPPWSEVAPMTTARSNHAATAYGGKIYVFGGVDQSRASLSSVEVYDPLANAWTAGTSLPVTLAFSRAETVGSRTFLINSNAPVRIFNHSNNTWSTGAASPFNDPSFDTDVWVDTVNNRSFVVVAASNLAGSTIDVFGYEVNQNLWYSGISLGTSDHRWFALNVIGDNIFLNGGYRQFMTSKVFSGNYGYNLNTDVWTTTGLGSPSVVRYSATAVNLNNRMLVLGGQTVAVGALRDAGSYDPATNGWSVLPSMLRARNNFPTVVLSGKVYAIGGSDAGSTPLNFVEAYTP